MSATEIATFAATRIHFLAMPAVPTPFAPRGV